MTRFGKAALYGGGAVLAAAALAGVIFLRTPAPVGHWTGKAAQDRYLVAYAAAFDRLPRPEQVLDIRTDYGVVRVYWFKGRSEGRAPLVLLPGRASASPVWAANLPSLLAFDDVYLVDLLGEPGLSIQGRPIADDADQAAWLAQVIEALPEKQVNLVGLSIGGWTAVNLALHEPAKIVSLTLIEPALVFGNLPLETIVRSIPAALPFTPKAWRDDFNAYTAGGASVRNEPVAHLIEAGMAGYRLRLPAPARITEEQLGSLRLPTLVFLAGRSVMHDGAEAKIVAERALPSVTVRFFPEATHAINGEYPDQIAAEMRTFLTSPATP